MDLKDKIALVTGSAHRVGKAIALSLAKEGANTIIHYGQSDDSARRTRADIEGLGAHAITVAADLSRPEDIHNLFKTIEDTFGHLDILVNSAATFTKRAFNEISVHEWDHTFAVNLRAPFLCSQHAARLMMNIVRLSPGLIVNIGDLSGQDPWNGYVQHGISKAALRHLTKCLARELAPHIRSNTLVLGPVLPPPGQDTSSEEWVHLTQSIPLERSAKPLEVGQAVVSLAQNDFITGAELHIDGGQQLLGPIGH
jgi:NAD(P)-dependent dehydrogenase (short-subunit alcohol dehydrogenase family)